MRVVLSPAELLKQHWLGAHRSDRFRNGLALSAEFFHHARDEHALRSRPTTNFTVRWCFGDS
jgi:hypothetical protein